MNKQYAIQNCKHDYKPLGFKVIGTDDKFVEIAAVIFCGRCSTFRTKILRIDRHRKNDYPEDRG